MDDWIIVKDNISPPKIIKNFENDEFNDSINDEFNDSINDLITNLDSVITESVSKKESNVFYKEHTDICSITNFMKYMKYQIKIIYCNLLFFINKVY